MLFKVSEVVIVGCGGIGSHLIPPLCQFLCAKDFQGRISLWDRDVYTEGNRNRQRFRFPSIGVNKAEALVTDMAGEYPSLRITAYPEWVVEDSVRRAVTENCVVISCVDNHPARRTISQALSKLENGIMISAGNELIDGDVCVQIRVDGKNLTQTVLERHPEILTATEGDRTGKGCEDEINQGVTQLLVTNLMAATMAFSLFHRLWVTEDKENLPQEAFFNLEVGKAVVYDVDKPKGAEDQTAVSALHIPTIPDVSSATDSSADKLPQHAHVVRKARKRAKKKESSQ